MDDSPLSFRPWEMRYTGILGGFAPATGRTSASPPNCWPRPWRTTRRPCGCTPRNPPAGSGSPGRFDPRSTIPAIAAMGWTSPSTAPARSSASRSGWRPFIILPRATVGRQLRALRTYGSHAAQARAGAQATYAAGVQEQHWHLLAVGVSAKARGRGHGQDLIAAGMYRAAADGVPVHLETTNPNNLSFYERLGFDTTAVIDLPGGGPRRWLMRQVPQPISSPARGRRSRST